MSETLPLSNIEHLKSGGLIISKDEVVVSYREKTNTYFFNGISVHGQIDGKKVSEIHSLTMGKISPSDYVDDGSEMLNYFRQMAKDTAPTISKDIDRHEEWAIYLLRVDLRNKGKLKNDIPKYKLKQ